METSSLIAKLNQLQSELTSLRQPTEQGSASEIRSPLHQADLSQLISHIRAELQTIEPALSPNQPDQHLNSIPLQAVLNQLPIAILLSEPDTHQYCWANLAFHNLLGYSKSQLQAQDWHKLIDIKPPHLPEPTIYKGSIQTESGKVLVGRVAHIPIHNHAHEVIYYMSLVTIPERLSPLASEVKPTDVQVEPTDQVLLHQLQVQVEQQKQLRQTVQTIRQSLDLQTVFSTSVKEVSRFLKANWVLLVQYHSQQRVWEQVTQYNPQDQRLHELHISDKLLQLAPLLKRRQQPLHINLSSADAYPAYPVWLSYFPGSWLLVPIHLPPRSLNEQPILWGVMALGYPKFSETWDSIQEMFAETIVQEVAIAIQQSLLYQQLQQANQELQALALTDSLTQIANRRQFDLHLESEWQRLAREQQPLSLILCDIDFFKRYNDHYGHPTGDRCLLKVAQALVHAPKRPADLVARYGGEEFAVILPNTHTKGAYRVAHKIRQGIAALQITHPDSELSPWLTVTIGIATAIPNRNVATHELLQAADLALYHAKQQGRDRIYIHAHYTCPPPEDTRGEEWKVKSKTQVEGSE
ncbi:MAG: diguanylate cyclase [Cyanobacteria bacterium P01_D01_bin.44]